ncbi:hypothetical protein [Sphingobacterium sp. E70]|uniref:hypothetical protein n=1 Tax=Sphingobacterium sp. E70 TaxID=2853439 RepID=UPI002795FA91|nr:hypothetical protein [Sphingobacterium sp. E70]
MLRSLPILLLSISLGSTALAQKRYTLSGTITDVSTGETLIGASVKLRELPQSGSSSNSYGFYSMAAPKEGIYSPPPM